MSLTGGTRDVNPQPMKFQIKPPAAVTSATPTIVAVAVPIPVQRIPSGRRAQVMEILKLQYDINFKKTTVTDTAALNSMHLTLSSRSYSTTAVPVYLNADPFIIYSAKHVPTNSAGGGTVAGGTANNANDPFLTTQMVDLTDGAGHGVLYGHDTLFGQGQFLATLATTTLTTDSCYNVCIWYRWKNVGFTEYVGMVTGQ